jgi:hypothetical protein
MVMNYLQGLLWVMDIYVSGAPYDYHYICDGGDGNKNNKGLDDQRVSVFIRNNVNSDFPLINSPICADLKSGNCADVNARNPLAPLTAAISLIPSNVVQSFLNPDDYEKVRHIVSDTQHELMGNVVAFENDERLAKLKANLGTCGRAHQQARDNCPSQMHKSEVVLSCWKLIPQ